MPEHPQPLILVSFPDPADVRRAWEVLRNAFRCEFEDGGILLVDRTQQPGGATWTLRHGEREDRAYRAVADEVSVELARAEARGAVPTLPSRHRGRPSPNELATWAKAAGWLLVEDSEGADSGKRLAAAKLVAAFNDHLSEEGLTDLVVDNMSTRRLYAALRDSVPGIQICPDTSGGRMYVLGVDWSPEAKAWRTLPPFKVPYS